VLQAREWGKDFKYGYIMIDKCRQEMAAVRQLVLSKDAQDWLLCYFHLLQEWERFASSKDSGLERPAQHILLVQLAALAHTRSEALFREKVGRIGQAVRGGWGGLLGAAS